MDNPSQPQGIESLKSILNKLRGEKFQSSEELAEYLSKENVVCSTDDLLSLGYLLTGRIHSGTGPLYVPEWLARTFVALIDGMAPAAICDPWAGGGSLVAVLQEAYGPKEALAITQHSGEHALGKVLVPKANWQLGNSLDVLGKENREFDVVASVLPMGTKSESPLVVTPASDIAIEIKGDLANQIMVVASMRLVASGVGLFVVTPAFFFTPQSAFHHFGELGLGIEAALALPVGTFAPSTNRMAYLIVVRRRPTKRMFVAQLTSDLNTNLQIIANFQQKREGSSLELGKFVVAADFRSFDDLRTSEAISAAEKQFEGKVVRLAEMGTVNVLFKRVDTVDEPQFLPEPNAIYIPLFGCGVVVDSPDDFKHKPQSYAQVVIDPARSHARFVAGFLNSDLGKTFREQALAGVATLRLNRRSVGELQVVIPDLKTQGHILDVETRIAAEHNTVMGLHNEITELRRELWSNLKSAPQIHQKIAVLANRLAGSVTQHASESFDTWVETLPFPMASILRAWQATPSRDFKTKYEHLLHFFEGTAQFVSIVLLSAFSSNETIFAPHRRKINEVMKRQHLTFERATFGAWKIIIEILGKETRRLMNESGKKADEAKNDRDLCSELFVDHSCSLPEALSRTELASVIAEANKRRNDWSGHGGVVGHSEAESRNQLLLAEVQKLREIMADVWKKSHLIRPISCIPRKNVVEHEVAVLKGSNSEFLKETCKMAKNLDVDFLFLSSADSGKALQLLPLIQVGPSPQSVENACYFFNRLEKEGARFISYHFEGTPELKDTFVSATEAIRLLSKV